MKKQITSFIAAALLTLGLSTGISHATPWIGDVTLGQSTTPSVSLFEWEKQSITFNEERFSLQAVLSSLIYKGLNQVSTYENGTTTILNVEYSLDGNSDNDRFTINDIKNINKIDETIILIASGRLDINNSIYDYDLDSAFGSFNLLGSEIDYSSNASGPGFSGPPITGFKYSGSTETELDISSFTTSAPVPEPSTMMLSGLGLAGLLFAARRKRVASSK